MNPACKTIYYFAWYPLGAGLTMLLVPQWPLQLLGFPLEGLDWIRMLGVVTIMVAYYYFRLSQDGVLSFCRYSTQMRLLIPLVFSAMVLGFDLPPVYVALTFGDVLGGLWTWQALRSQGIAVFSRA